MAHKIRFDKIVKCLCFCKICGHQYKVFVQDPNYNYCPECQLKIDKLQGKNE